MQQPDDTHSDNAPGQSSWNLKHFAWHCSGSAVLDLGVAFGDELFLTGYSQGAHVNATPAVSTPLYLTYAVLGLDQVYGFVDDWNEVFLEPYAETAFDLFDGEHEAADIVAALPSDPAQLFQPTFLADLAAGVGDFAEALRLNNVYDWAPAAPVRLFHGGADADVPFRNAEVAAARMTELGADVQVVNVGAELDHTTASTPSYIGAKAWFDSILGGTR